MSVQLLDKTRKINKLLHNNNSSKVVFNADGSIVETNSLGQKKTTVFQGENVIVETFVGEKTLVKTTTINSDGTITEEIS